MQNIKSDIFAAAAQRMADERIYELYMLWYMLILSIGVAIGFVTLGFTLPGYSQQVNLLWNFLWMCLLTAAMACAPLWQRLLGGRKLINRHTKAVQEIQDYLSKLGLLDNPHAHRLLQKMYHQQGRLAPSRLQLGCMVFLAWMALFEVFFISAWAKEGVLI